ncbi:MAG: BolA/IbaG family iron-sulfur metabolism protein [Burkholderiales bacterium]|nr:BolA/IbaG family iron-sulfur metabolism protein [Burkholderiales bacterium]
MTVQATIEKALSERLHPLHLEVVNESAMHSVPSGSESHFKVTIVSEVFVEKNLLARHRMINEILAQQLAGPVHALALHPLTPDEWFDKGGRVAQSPPCHGGSKSA